MAEEEIDGDVEVGFDEIRDDDSGDLTLGAIEFDGLTPTDFEEFCFDLLSEAGFVNIDWRKGTPRASSPADRGRDIVAQLERKEPDGHRYDETWFVDCKHYHRGVPPEALQGAITWAQAERPDTVLFMASGYLSNAAKDWIADFTETRPPFRIRTWERPQVRRLLANHLDVAFNHNVQTSSLRRVSEILKAEAKFGDALWYGRKPPDDADLSTGTRSSWLGCAMHCGRLKLNTESNGSTATWAATTTSPGECSPERSPPSVGSLAWNGTCSTVDGPAAIENRAGPGYRRGSSWRHSLGNDSNLPRSPLQATPRVPRRGRDRRLVSLADELCGDAIVPASNVARAVRHQTDTSGDPSQTRQDGRIGVAPVKVGPSACASRTADAALLTAAPSDAAWQRGPGWTSCGQTPTQTPNGPNNSVTLYAQGARQVVLEPSNRLCRQAI